MKVDKFKLGAILTRAHLYGVTDGVQSASLHSSSYDGKKRVFWAEELEEEG